MPSNINQQPLGLLSLLSIKATGDTPKTLGSELIPTLDLTNAYVASQLVRFNSVTPAVNAPGVFGGIVVPPGEVWIVPQFAIVKNAVNGAGTSYRIRCGVIDAQTGVAYAVSATSDTSGVGDAVYLGFGQPLIVPAGMQFALLCEQFAGIAAQFAVCVWYTHLTQ
jgi:hypothetical protein